MPSATALPGCLGPPVQIAYAVPDAEAEARRWAHDGGVGPFFLRSHIEVRDVVHRGRPGVFDHTSAYAQWGTLMVELLQDHGTGPSAVRDMYAPDESGLHHVAYMVDDLDAALAALTQLGLETAMSATTTGGVEFHFVDALASHGHLLELYQRSDRLAGFYAAVARAADGWDGEDPVRPF